MGPDLWSTYTPAEGEIDRHIKEENKEKDALLHKIEELEKRVKALEQGLEHLADRVFNMAMRY